MFCEPRIQIDTRVNKGIMNKIVCTSKQEKLNVIQSTNDYLNMAEHHMLTFLLMLQFAISEALRGTFFIVQQGKSLSLGMPLGYC